MESTASPWDGEDILLPNGGRMLGAIIRKEIQGNLYSFKFLVVFLLLAVLIATSLFIMYKDYRLRQENYEVLRPESTQAIAIIPPSPLSIFVKGLDENMGRSYEVQFAGQIKVGREQQSVNDLFRLFVTPDLLFVIKIVAALCAMLFAFDLISGEKESRTLSLFLSNRVRRSTVLLGKWIGGFTSFIVPFLILLLAGVILIALSPHVRLDTHDWMRLGVFVAASVVYLALFFSLGLFVSTITHEPASSLVLSLFAWVFIVFIIPNTGNILARQFVTIQSVEQLEIKRNQIWIREVFKRINQGEGNPGTFQKTVTAIHDENTKLMAEHRTDFIQLVSLSKTLSRISPAAAFTYFSTDVMGVGIGDELRVKDAVLRYRESVWKLADTGSSALVKYPAFTVQNPSFTRGIGGDGLVNMTILLLYLLMAVAGSSSAFLLYDAR